jgi:Leucine-rich repeat (LRR) protein
MPSLKVLDFWESDVDDEGLACVKDATQLATMSFFNSRGISDKGLVHFQGLKNLTSLDLRNERFAEKEPKTPRITDAGVKHLAGLTRLQNLNLMGQHVTDEGLKHLSGMTNLRSLALSFSGITDEGLKHLEELRSLHSLHLYGTRVTPAGRAALKAKLPLLGEF